MYISVYANKIENLVSHGWLKTQRGIEAQQSLKKIFCKNQKPINEWCYYPTSLDQTLKITFIYF